MLFTIRAPTSEAESLSFEEDGGIALYLNDRFLPYRPITIGGKQRAEFTWYPGSPEATVQMLGPEEDTIQLRGWWKDRFFTLNSVSVFPATNAVQVPSNLLVQSVADLVQTVDNMRRMGRQITMKWSGMTRVGHIVAFRQTWHNIHDCEWEIDFAVMSQGEKTVPNVGAVQISLPDVYAEALKIAADIQDRIFEASGLPAALALSATASAALNTTNLVTLATANALAGVVTGYTGSVVSFSQGVRRTVAVLTGAPGQLVTAAGASAESAATEFYSWAAYGSQDGAPLGTLLTAEYYTRRFGSGVKNARYNYIVTRNQVAQQAAALEAQIQVFVAPQNLDMRDVSTQFYGTPDYWRQLMQYNNLTDSRLTAGQRINVPPVSSFTAALGSI